MGFWIGQFFLWTGFIAAAFATVRQQEVVDDKWSTIAWPWYLGAMAVGIVGAIMIRSSTKASQQSSEKVDAQYSVLVSQLAVLRQSLAELRSVCDGIAPSQLVKLIDDRCALPFAEFADSRNALIQRFGLNGFAEVMTQFASGERFVNRAWSAAADGYMDEAAASLERAENHLTQASEKISVLNKTVDQFSQKAEAPSAALDVQDDDDENERYFNERNF